MGKSTLTIRLITDNFIEAYNPTIEDSFKKTVTVDGETCNLEVTDTAGQEDYSSLQDGWIRDGNAFLLVYNITDLQSYEDLHKVREKIIRIKEQTSAVEIPIVLVGNKCDLETSREVAYDTGKSLADLWGCTFYETSAKLKINSAECFYAAVRSIRNIHNKKYNQPVDTKKKKRWLCAIL